MRRRSKPPTILQAAIRSCRAAASTRRSSAFPTTSATGLEGEPTMTPTQELIAAELYKAMERLGAPPKLLGAIGAWRDGLSDKDVLAVLRTWNQKGNL